ncbi:MAG: neutral zinc metallopeptidase, partial [Actinobacteria bacterium]|nr:neutral zinc metallopeptidase [Actinomycetota bacterium]
MRVLVVVAPLRLTLWVLAVATAAIVVLVAIGIARHFEWVRADRRRERVRGELESTFSRFFETEDRGRLADELGPAFMRMVAAHRPVAAALVTDLMQEAPSSQKQQLRTALAESGIVELGRIGTRRLSPGRRSLPREMLGLAFPVPLLAALLVLAACGSTGGSATKQRSTTTSTTNRSMSTQAAGHELDAFPTVAGLPATRLPAAPTSSKVEQTFLVELFDDVQSVWRREFAAAHEPYRAARVVVFYSQIESGCGKHQGSGPFYCGADNTVYLDLRFFSILLNLARVGTAAQAYIVGHEVGHHVQRLAGVASHVDALNQADPSRQNARAVQVELQADCLAGVW